jgi:nucleotide-binding universal stress UspA family protein
VKNILLLVHADIGQEARLQTALDLTRALDGHLTCIDVTPPVLVLGDARFGLGSSPLIIDERESEAKNRAATSARIAQEGVSWNWLDVRGEIAACVLDAAALADIIVLNRQPGDFASPDMKAIINRILMQGRVPVLAPPHKQQRFDAAGRAFIAWDGQASAIATVRACIPLLALASNVDLFTVRNGSGTVSALEAARYLSRHGITANIETVEDGPTPPEILIEQAARKAGADYIVMGAYSHGRLAETFGGVTKYMLANSSLPLVLGH